MQTKKPAPKKNTLPSSNSKPKISPEKLIPNKSPPVPINGK